ncbi:MAG: hypothetical protein C0507_02650 [Cyanobacteria bacterium PR.3.49]|nr:hypothetical protein [Cyanobacteria bacterium PR.3.49]
MGGGIEFNQYELQPDERTTVANAADAALQEEQQRLQAGNFERAQYQAGQVEKPYGTTGWRSPYGGDTQQTFNQGTEPQRGTNGQGQWRANYGQDAGTTFVPGTQAQTQNNQGGWRRPYGADSPLVTNPPNPVQQGQDRPPVTTNNGGDIDPLTGQPLRRPTPVQGNPWDRPANVPGQQQGTGDNRPGGQSTNPQITNARRIVDQSMEYNTVGYGGNLVAGAMGGVFGSHTMPWIMDKVSSTVKLDAQTPPNGFREKVVRYWQDNHDPARWNRTDLEFAKNAVDGPNGLSNRFAEYGRTVQEGLDFRTSRAKLLGQFDDLTLADDVKRAAAADIAINRNAQVVAGGGKPIFTTGELKYLNDMKTTGAAVPAGFTEMVERNNAALRMLEQRAKAFASLGDPTLPLTSKPGSSLISRATTLDEALQAHESYVRSGRSGILNGQKGLFTPDELKYLNEYKTATQSAVTATELSAVGKAKVFAGKYAPSIVKGAGVAGTLMVVDHYADSLFGFNHKNGIGDSINSALVPAALLVGPKTSMMKMGVVGVGALMAGKMIGSALPEGEQTKYSRYFRQSTLESGVLAAEALLPFKPLATSGVGKFVNWKQAALIGGTWAAFRLKNAILDPEPQAETRDRAWGLLKDDVSNRTDNSMMSAIDKFGALSRGDESTGLMAWTNWFKEGQGKVKGARGDSALQVYRTEWLTKQTSSFGSMLEANRGAAILCTAFAESRLAHGTHVSTITDTPTYLLQGKDLDLGGKAARDFIIARNNIEGAKKQVQDNLGREIAGKKVEQSEITDLDNVKKRIEAQEAKIYGEHDISGAVRELAKWGEGLNATHMAKIEKDLRDTIAANNNSQDNRYKAKLMRDLAVIYLSGAYAKQEGDPQSASKLLGGDTYSGRQALDMTGQPRGFDGALDCIARAHQLDPNNPDVARLYEVAQQINSKLPGNIQKQMNQGKYNPLQIRQ